jgi:putative phage-type endonuclease
MTEQLTQGSPEWHAARCGKVTASRVADIIAKTKSGASTSRANYMAELVAERLTGRPADSYVSPAMQWGIDNEPAARDLYAFDTGAEIETVGFVMHPRLEMAGASPDGLVSDFGLVEVKCPLTATHIDTLLGRIVPAKYVTQMQWQMACTDRAWCDFVSFDPRLPGNMSIFVQRVHRDNDMIAELENEVRGFLAELDAKVTALRSLYDAQEAA